jgi:hypothetical protein
MATIERIVNEFTATIERNGNTFSVTVGRSPQVFNITLDRVNGQTGLSAYQVALANGFIGTEAQWLASLKGDPINVVFSATEPANPQDGLIWFQIL